MNPIESSGLVSCRIMGCITTGRQTGGGWRMARAFPVPLLQLKGDVGGCRELAVTLRWHLASPSCGSRSAPHTQVHRVSSESHTQRCLAHSQASRFAAGKRASVQRRLQSSKPMTRLSHKGLSTHSPLPPKIPQNQKQHQTSYTPYFCSYCVDAQITGVGTGEG